MFSAELFAETTTNEDDGKVGGLQGSGGRLPRRRWSRRLGGDSVLMVKSMLDLRQLDSFCPDDDGRRKSHDEEAVLQKATVELGSTVSLQVSLTHSNSNTVRNTALPRCQTCVFMSVQVEKEAMTNQRPHFILLSNHSPETDDPVLYPDQWEDRVSLAGR